MRNTLVFGDSTKYGASPGPTSALVLWSPTNSRSRLRGVAGCRMIWAGFAEQESIRPRGHISRLFQELGMQLYTGRSPSLAILSRLPLVHPGPE